MLTLENLIQNKDMKGAKERIQKSNTLLICTNYNDIKEGDVKERLSNFSKVHKRFDTKKMITIDLLDKTNKRVDINGLYPDALYDIYKEIGFKKKKQFMYILLWFCPVFDFDLKKLSSIIDKDLLKTGFVSIITGVTGRDNFKKALSGKLFVIKESTKHMNDIVFTRVKKTNVRSQRISRRAKRISRRVRSQRKKKKPLTKKQPINMNTYTPFINRSILLSESAVKHSDLVSPKCYEYSPNKFSSVSIEGKCVRSYLKIAQKQLLRNMLLLEDNINPQNIISPIQKQTNCWFNTMFMTLFISDKGRKFFRFFRRLMITGKYSKGNTITPTKLRIALSNLNIAIESSLTGKINPVLNNTNNIIEQIYLSQKKTDRHRNLKNREEYGNPFYYYMALINYLKSDNLFIKILGRESRPEQCFHVNLYCLKDSSDMSYDMIVFETDDELSYEAKQREKLIYNGEGFVLDSCCLRDTSKKHYISFLTIQKKEYVFDGGSHKKLVEFGWKKYIDLDLELDHELMGLSTNVGKKWNFKQGYQWNFKQGYQYMFYYRV